MKGTAGKRNDMFTIQLLSQAKEDYIYIKKTLSKSPQRYWLLYSP